MATGSMLALIAAVALRRRPGQRLDVTENLKGIISATQIAEEIRARIRAETELMASAGVSYNKFLAKLASDHRKPDGRVWPDPILPSRPNTVTIRGMRVKRCARKGRRWAVSPRVMRRYCWRPHRQRKGAADDALQVGFGDRHAGFGVSRGLT